MAVKDINVVFENILKDSKKNASSAVATAARSLEKHMMKIADRCLEGYYQNYTPNVYERTKHLHNAVKPIYINHSSRGNISYEVGVEYDSSRLENWYYSNSQYHQSGNKWVSVRGLPAAGSNFGVPDSGWILTNYLTGVHPWAQTDSINTHKTFINFINNKAQAHINKYVMKSIESKILSKL
jgi:hypothetical protein